MTNFNDINDWFRRYYNSNWKKITETDCKGRKIHVDRCLLDLLSHIGEFEELNHVAIGESKVHGKGVFATKDIHEGDIITLYPGDIVLYMMNFDGENSAIPIFSKRIFAKSEEKGLKIEKSEEPFYGLSDHSFIVNDN